ncbi:MAG: threonylcarbamoyl-AMP synthase, partial [Clostridia bacterium]|nr:threonylcarbamoyl-AMP synthase [Clostridia bacterium]
MNTLFFDIRDPENSMDAVRQAAELLQKGEVVAMPTETVYGLAANAFDREAVAKIFVAKGRPQDNPLIVHIADVNDLYLLASEVPETALKLAEKFWPGPLTMILPKKERVPDVVSGGLPTVAVRMPSHKGANALIRAAGVPLAAPSANISGFPSPTEMRHVADDMQGRIAAVCDGGNCGFGVESTVISLATEVPTLLRPGSITKEQLESVLGEVLVDNAVLHPLKEGETVSSPGMKYRHYAPKAKITIVRGDANAFHAFMKEEDHKTDFALCFEEDVPFMPKNYVTFGSENDPLSQTNRLFEALRELDERGAERVWAREPSTEGVGLAVCNRLYRAAGFQFVTRRAYVIGVTGATGAGKSTLCRYFKES